MTNTVKFKRMRWKPRSKNFDNCFSKIEFGYQKKISLHNAVKVLWHFWPIKVSLRRLHKLQIFMLFKKELYVELSFNCRNRADRFQFLAKHYFKCCEMSKHVATFGLFSFCETLCKGQNWWFRCSVWTFGLWIFLCLEHNQWVFLSKSYQFKRWWRKSTYYFGKEIPFEHLASRTGSFQHFRPIRVLIHKQNHKFCLKNHSMIINLRIATAVGERNTACVLREKYCDHRKKSQQLAVFVFSAIRHLMRGKQPPLFFGINYYK